MAASPEAQTARDKRRSGRSHPKADTRSPSQRDRDKILYSSALQRLTGVTQVVTPEPGGALTHNRLTHSLKVAQVAQSIAALLLADESRHEKLQTLGGLDVSVAEAAALGHDLGHPPFGHIGESVLDEFARESLQLHEGFEGNAQSFRIVALLDARSPGYDGMDLTAATRAALLKYPWSRVERASNDQEHESRLMDDPTYSLKWRKFGYYEEDSEDFAQARQVPGADAELQTVEAAIMDLADDVTYALHDLQDFYMARVLPVPAVSKQLDSYVKHAHKRKNDDSTESEAAAFAALARKLTRDYPDRFDHDEYVKAVGHVGGDIAASFRDYFDASPETAANVTKFVSQKIGQLTEDIHLNLAPTGQTPAVHLSSRNWHEVQVLKHLTSLQIIGRPDMAVYQRAQQRVLRDLLRAMKDWAEDREDNKRLPEPLRTWQEEAADSERNPRRCLIDFVASLSDHQALGLHQALRGNGGSLVNALIL